MRENLAWAAGFFDGEGCVMLTKRLRRGKRGWKSFSWGLRVTATNTDIRPLLRLKEMFQGSIQPVSKKGNSHGYLPSWAWVVSDRTAANFLDAVMPWLLVKHEQAELAILSRRHVKAKGERYSVEDKQSLEWFKREISTLKTTGLELPGSGIIQPVSE